MMNCLEGKALESFQKAQNELAKTREELQHYSCDNMDNRVKLEDDVSNKVANLTKRILGMKESSYVWNKYVLSVMNSSFGQVHADYATMVGGFAKNFCLNEIQVQKSGYLERLADMLNPCTVEKNGLPKCFGDLFMAVSNGH